jgi:uncharacterized membrane protein YhaH (DUF805 family)
VLFNPQGRIGPRLFWQGVILIIVAWLLLGALSVFGPMAASATFGLLSLLLVYPSLCVFGKRLHDASKSAWWFVAVIAAFVVIYGIVAALLTRGAADELRRGMESLPAGSPEWMSMIRGIAQRTFLPTRVAATLVGLGLAFFVSRLPRDLEDNRYGPPVSDAPSAAEMRLRERWHGHR